MADNARLIQHSKKVEDDRKAMSEVLQHFSRDAAVIKGRLDEEISGYQHAKGQLSDLRRTNFVLWKHIKKLKRKYRKLKTYGTKTIEELHEDLVDDEELRQMKQELDLLANDPDLATDLKQLKRETKNVGTHIQEELLPTFYDIDTVCEMIGDSYLIIAK